MNASGNPVAGLQQLRRALDAGLVVFGAADPDGKAVCRAGLGRPAGEIRKLAELGVRPAAQPLVRVSGEDEPQFPLRRVELLDANERGTVRVVPPRLFSFGLPPSIGR